MKTVNYIFILLFSLSIAGCGATKQDRAVSGAGIGGGIGAVGAAVTGGSVITGTAFGAAVGAATGAVTDEEDIHINAN